MAKYKYNKGDLVGPYKMKLIERTINIRGRYYALFECPICHNIFEYSVYEIVKGSMKQCPSCLEKRTNLIGMHFGRLTVIAKSDKKTKNGQSKWICQCDCENKTIIEVTGSNLKMGRTRSCGCLQREQAKQLNYQNLTGQRFGKLVVIKDLGSDIKPGSHVWLCKCDCGNTVEVITDLLKNGSTKSCGCIKSYGEFFISSYLRENNIKFILQKTFDTCINPKTNYKLRFDFYLPDYNLCIECDGVQHRKKKPDSLFSKEELEEILYRDNIKNQWCEQNNVELLRIPYNGHQNIQEVEKILNTYFNIGGD